MKRYSLYLAAAVLLISQLACEALNPANVIENIDPEAIIDALPDEMDIEQIEPLIQEAVPEVEEQNAPLVQEENLVSISAAGITLWYDPNVLIEVSAEAVPAITEELVYETVHPEYAMFTFPGLDGYIAVVPVAPMEQLVPEAGQSFQLLKNALSAQPESFDKCAPQVPLMYFYHECSHQQFAANVDYLDFVNGNGMRFVSVYAIQDLAPVNNDNLVYIFEGFTEDGKYYLTGEMGIDNEMLALAGDSIPQDVYTDLEGSIMREFFKGFEIALNEAELMYEPSLDYIDRVFTSIKVE
ncbi:MAG: hypothetical protein JXA25_12200 [Anaerolineales bacterium]|nr:hypothetical protein [Anaerolineales bacterium]